MSRSFPAPACFEDLNKEEWSLLRCTTGAAGLLHHRKQLAGFTLLASMPLFKQEHHLHFHVRPNGSYFVPLSPNWYARIRTQLNLEALPKYKQLQAGLKLLEFHVDLIYSVSGEQGSTFSVSSSSIGLSHLQRVPITARNIPCVMLGGELTLATDHNDYRKLELTRWSAGVRIDTVFQPHQTPLPGVLAITYKSSRRPPPAPNVLANVARAAAAFLPATSSLGSASLSYVLSLSHRCWIGTAVSFSMGYGRTLRGEYMRYGQLVVRRAKYRMGMGLAIGPSTLVKLQSSMWAGSGHYSAKLALQQYLFYDRVGLFAVCEYKQCKASERGGWSFGVGVELR